MTAIADRIVALVWVVVGIIVIVEAGQISGGGANAQDALGPRAFPQAVGAALTVLGLWLLLSEPITKLFRRAGAAVAGAASRASAEAGASAGQGYEQSAPAAQSVPPWQVPGAIAITIGYVVLLPIIHYVPATLAASVAMLAGLLAVR